MQMINVASLMIIQVITSIMMITILTKGTMMMMNSLTAKMGTVTSVVSATASDQGTPLARIPANPHHLQHQHHLDPTSASSSASIAILPS